MSQTLSVRLDETTARALEKEACQTGRSKGEIVRAALSAHLRTSPGNALDSLTKYIGTISGPSDLSTGKRHLAGFGKSRRP